MNTKNQLIDYKELINKLIQLGEYTSIKDTQEHCFDMEILSLSNTLEKEIIDMLFDYNLIPFLEALASSGLMDVFYGDSENNGNYIVMGIRSLNILNNNHIELYAGKIHTNSKDLPSDIMNNFGSRYIFEQK